MKKRNCYLETFYQSRDLILLSQSNRKSRGLAYFLHTYEVFVNKTVVAGPARIIIWIFSSRHLIFIIAFLECNTVIDRLWGREQRKRVGLWKFQKFYIFLIVLSNCATQIEVCEIFTNLIGAWWIFFFFHSSIDIIDLYNNNNNNSNNNGNFAW